MLDKQQGKCYNIIKERGKTKISPAKQNKRSCITLEIKVNITKTIEKIEGLKFRSIWDKAVQEDASWLMESLFDDHFDEIVNDTMTFQSMGDFEYVLRMGAETWKDFSEGGCALIYDGDIAKHYCTNSELKKTHNGEKAPNSKESWLDVQARAFWQAALLVKQNLVTE